LAKTTRKDLLQETIHVWQPDSFEPITLADAKTIIENTAAFFDLLAEWEKQETRKLGSKREN